MDRLSSALPVAGHIHYITVDRYIVRYRLRTNFTFWFFVVLPWLTITWSFCFVRDLPWTASTAPRTSQILSWTNASRSSAWGRTKPKQWKDLSWRIWSSKTAGKHSTTNHVDYWYSIDTCDPSYQVECMHAYFMYLVCNTYQVCMCMHFYLWCIVCTRVFIYVRFW